MNEIIKAIESNGRVFCLSCRIWVYRDDVNKHEGHKLVISVFEEPHAHEETYTAD